MTIKELRDILNCYDDDTPVFDSKGYDLHPSAIREATYDIWTGEVDADGYETPLIGRALAIGQRF